jgi:hypothetical protein
MDDGRWRWAASCGVLLGITLLSKIGMIAVLPIPAVAVGLYAVRNTQPTSVKHRIAWSGVRGAIIYGLALLLAGWWYWRNLTLYGDPLMWREWQALTGTGRVPPTPLDFLRDMLGFFGLFWTDFSLRVDRVLWPIFGVIVIGAGVGLIRRAIKRQWPALDWPGLLVALVWLGLLIAAAVRYSFNIYDIHGRLLYPARDDRRDVGAGVVGLAEAALGDGDRAGDHDVDRGAGSVCVYSASLRSPHRSRVAQGSDSSFGEVGRP